MSDDDSVEREEHVAVYLRFRQVFGHALPAWEDGVGRCIDALK